MNDTATSIIPAFSREDYLLTTKPYEWVYSNYAGNALQEKQMISLVSQAAKLLGVRNFATLYRDYCKSVDGRGLDFSGRTDFTDQPAELQCGEWVCDDAGVRRTNTFGIEVYACPHPIEPTQRVTNIDSGIEKLRIAFRKGKQWRELIAEKRVIASAQQIVGLSSYGIAVTSENARELVKYISDVEAINYDTIPDCNSCSRLGWVGDHQFAPYVDDLVFDGDAEFKRVFDSVVSHGSREKWMDEAHIARKGSLYARIILAASFASALIAPCGCLPFMLHLWGGTGAGKTVGLMMAASVWANPELGKYVITFNSSAVGQEYQAGFLNSLPCCLDELMIERDRSNFDKMIYQLCEGTGKLRGKKEGGIKDILTWRCCFLTTGEKPIIGSTSLSGAANRVIEIDCKDVKLFEDGNATVSILKQNYGFVGREWAEWLSMPENSEAARAMWREKYEAIAKNGKSTPKLAASAALILTADELSEKMFFRDGLTIKQSDIEPLLLSKDDVDQNIRALEFISGFVAANQTAFNVTDHPRELFGKITDDYYCIISTQFDRIMTEEGFSPEAFKSWAKRNGVIKLGKNETPTCTQRFGNGVTAKCVCITKDKLNSEDDILPDEIDDFDIPELPM